MPKKPTEELTTKSNRKARTDMKRASTVYTQATTDDYKPISKQGKQVIGKGKAPELPKGEDKLVAQIVNRREDLKEAYRNIHKEGMDALKFSVGGDFQWPDEILKLRDKFKKPRVTINRVRAAIKQVNNEQRQNRPGIKYSPVDDLADPKTAEMLTGAVRHIESNSMSDVAIDTACEGQVTHGFGYMKIRTDYASPWSFEQEIYIRRVQDPFKIYLGPYDEFEDLDEMIEEFDYTHEEYKNIYPKSQFAKLDSFKNIGNQFPGGWTTEKTIKVVEYTYRVWEPRNIVLLSDRSVVYRDDLDQFEEDEYEDPESGAELGKGYVFEEGQITSINSVPVTPGMVLTVVDERETYIPSVHLCVTNGKEKLDTRTLPGMYVPIIPVLGDDIIVNNRRYLYGIVKDAMDPQRQYNLWRSNMTEIMSLAPKTPYIMADGQAEGHEDEWQTSNIQNFSALYYKPKSVDGQLVPPPQRNTFESPIQAFAHAGDRFEDDIKATTRVYDAKLGAKSNETSGRAISERKAQGDTSNYHYTDNLTRSLRYMGKVILDLIPKIYDVRTMLRIIGEDGETQRVSVVNDKTQPAYQEQTLADGTLKAIYNIGVGIYDVVPGVGPSYQTKRQEAFDMLTKLVNSDPEVMKVAGDIIMKYSDIPGAPEIARRLAANLPAHLQPMTGENMQNLPPQVALIIRQLTEQNKQLTQQLNDMANTLKNKTIEQEGKERVEMAKLQSNEDIAALQAQTKSLEISVKAQSDQMNRQMTALENMIKLFLAPGPVEGGQPAPATS